MPDTTRPRNPIIRRSEIAIAIPFLVTAAAAITGATLLEGVFEDPTDLAGIAAGQITTAAGAALWTVNNLGFVFIALFAWPVLSPVAPLMARAYVATRVIESGVMMIGVMALVTIPSLAATGAGAEVRLLHALSAVSLDAGMLPLLGFSGLFFTWSSPGRSCATSYCPPGSRASGLRATCSPRWPVSSPGSAGSGSPSKTRAS